MSPVPTQAPVADGDADAELESLLYDHLHRGEVDPWFEVYAPDRSCERHWHECKDVRVLASFAFIVRDTEREAARYILDMVDAVSCDLVDLNPVAQAMKAVEAWCDGAVDRLVLESHWTATSTLAEGVERSIPLECDSKGVPTLGAFDSKPRHVALARRASFDAVCCLLCLILEDDIESRSQLAQQLIESVIDVELWGRRLSNNPIEGMHVLFPKYADALRQRVPAPSYERLRALCLRVPRAM